MALFSFSRTRYALTSAALLIAGIAGTALPAAAGPMQAASNHNIWHVRYRLERDIAQLQHDDRDYGGYRVRAIENLQAARNDLLAAEEYERGHGITPGGGVQPDRPFDRGQWSSNRNMWRVRHNIERLIGQLDNDATDYGGYKLRAVRHLQIARMQLMQGERFAQGHGY